MARERAAPCDVFRSGSAFRRVGLRRILASLGELEADTPAEQPARSRPQPRMLDRARPEQREALIAQAREWNAQAFAPWTTDEEQEIGKRYQSAKSISAIARMHKRSPRAIELRLQRLGLLPRDAAAAP